MGVARPSQSAILCFGVFELDPRAGELRKQGVRIKLQGQPLQVLQILLEKAGEVVTRDELQKRVWPSGTFVDFDVGVYNAVKRLREALGDDAETPAYIETLPRRGYRFIAQVNGSHRSPTHAAVGAGAGTFRRPAGHRFLRRFLASRHRRLALGASGLALLLLVTVASKLVLKPTTTPRELHRVTRLTTSGSVRQAAISPDGRYVAYFQSEKGYAGWSLWLQQVGTSARTRLLPPDSISPAGDEGLRFSPDGDHVYYTRIDPNHAAHSLYRISVLGGTPEELFTNVPSRFALSPDGRSVAYLGADPRDGRDALVVVSFSGKIEKVVARVPQGATGFSDPSWSHDGGMLAVAEYLGGDELRNRFLVVPLDGGPLRRIDFGEFWAIGEPEWLADGSGLVATALGRRVAGSDQVDYEGHYPELWEFPYRGGSPRRITNDPFRYFAAASVSSDSSVLAAVATDLFSAVWVGPVSDPDQARAVTPPSGHFVANRGLTWTGSGSIVYWTNGSEAFDLIVMDPDGGNPRPLPRSLPFVMDPDACSDGHTLVYTGGYAGRPHVMIQNLNGGRPQPLAAGWRAQCSPDSRWVVYYDNSTRAIPKKMSIEGGQPLSLTDQECECAGISPNGEWVACVHETGKLAVIPASGGKPVKLFDLPPTFDRSRAPLRWTPDNQSVVYVVDEGEFDNLWAQPVAGGPRRALTHFTSQEIRSFAFSHDGKQVAIGRGTPSSDVVLIRNFR